MQKIFDYLCIVVLILLSLTACSSGPPDDFLLSNFVGDSGNISNVQILRKVKCDSISTTAKAKGVDEAWLVSFGFDIEWGIGGVDHRSSYVVLFVKSEGEWHTGWSKFGFEDDVCP